MGRNPVAGYNFNKKCINEYEIWRKGAMDKWSEHYVWEYNDGSANSKVLRGPFSEKEYFKLLLEGTVQ
jgi:hypothetical protein